MNNLIEILNHRGGDFLNFAGPMLWQSGLLISVLFAFEFLFRRKVRASIRYLLWLVVLIKLCVTPTFALPTSPAWWLHKTPIPVAAKAEPRYTVTYDSPPLPEISPTPTTAFVPPKAAMTKAAGLLLAAATVSVALLCWLLARWWQITMQIRRAPGSGRLTALAGETQKCLGTKFRVQVKLTPNSMSPAVCGLFRPVILIPQSLAENFPDEQLRAVLLHELIHLRRRDVWLNFFQALLQIAYWWHPLVWLANAHIRRVREEAVDDAVMLALRDEAEAYAPTLLAVAKLALNRPLASLGLVGILESRHALRQRIERLVDFRAPRRAGLTLVSLLGILAFTAVAVPMGQAPGSPDDGDLIATPASTSTHSWAPTNAPVVLVQAEIYRMRQTDFQKLVSDPAFVSTRKDEVENFQQFERLVKSSGFSPILRPRIQTASGQQAEFYLGNETNSIEFECLPLATNGLIKLANHIIMISTTESVTTTNKIDTQTTLQNGSGQVFSIRPPSGTGESNLVVVTVSVEIVTNKLRFHERLQAVSESSGQFAMTFNLNHPIRLDELQQKLLAAGVRIPPTVYFHNDDGRLLVRGTKEQLALVHQMVLKLNGYSSKDSEVETGAFVRQISGTGFEKPPISSMTNLFSRRFKVDTNKFPAALRKVTGSQTNNVSAMARDFFKTLGVDLDAPGKAVFYNDGLGELFVRATANDLDTVETALQLFTTAAPQIHIKARFIEAPKGTVAGLGNFLNSTNSAAGQFTGILNETNLRTILHLLESRKEVETLAEPEVVTTSGRQTQMRATQIITVVTNFAYKESLTNGFGSITPQMEQVETGPVLDVVPQALSDGYTINLTVIPSLTEFLGYDQPPDAHFSKHDADTKVRLPMVMPKFSVLQMTANLNLRDNQTLLMSGMNSTSVLVTKDKVPVLGDLPLMGRLFQSQSKTTVEKELLVFITATLVDPAGNRIHSDN